MEKLDLSFPQLDLKLRKAVERYARRGPDRQTNNEFYQQEEFIDNYGDILDRLSHPNK